MSEPPPAKKRRIGNTSVKPKPVIVDQSESALLQLSDDVIVIILQLLTSFDLLVLSETCLRLQSICLQTKSLWSSPNFTDHPMDLTEKIFETFQWENAKFDPWGIPEDQRTGCQHLRSCFVRNIQKLSSTQNIEAAKFLFSCRQDHIWSVSQLIDSSKFVRIWGGSSTNRQPKLFQEYSPNFAKFGNLGLGKVWLGLKSQLDGNLQARKT